MAYVPAPVVVPHPVIVPTGGGGGGDIPDSWVVSYCIIGVVIWIIASFVTVLVEARGPVDGEEIAFGIMVGACFALLWPLSLAAGALWLGIRRVLGG